MRRFDKWWNSSGNPALSLPQSSQTQIKDFMRSAFAAGVRSERDKRVVREADEIEARNMFKDVEK